MDCEAGEEYNFAYVLPQENGKPITLVIPTSLQMGWVESPPYFCAATKTARDITLTYCITMVGSLDSHKFIHNVSGDPNFNTLPVTSVGSTANELYYALEVYVDNFMSIVIPTSQQQLLHVATAVMKGIMMSSWPTVSMLKTQYQKRNCSKGRDNNPCLKHSWASTSTGVAKRCGLKRQSVQNSSQSCTVGSGPESSTRASHLRNTNRLWQDHITHS
jgi:hypothetical protein